MTLSVTACWIWWLWYSHMGEATAMKLAELGLGVLQRGAKRHEKH